MTLPPDLRSTRFPENGRSLQKTGSSGVFVGRYSIPRISPFRQALFESLRAASVCSANAFSENLSIVLASWALRELEFYLPAIKPNCPKDRGCLSYPQKPPKSLKSNAADKTQQGGQRCPGPQNRPRAYQLIRCSHKAMHPAFKIATAALALDEKKPARTVRRLGTPGS